MKISSFKHYASDALKSLTRNKTISMASVATVTATLFIMGVFLLTALNIRQIISNVESKVEVKVFLTDDINFTDQREIETTLKGMQGVREVVFESKSDALQKFREQLSEKDRGLLSGYDSNNNPLPNSYIVKMDNPAMAQAVEDKVKGMKGVDSIGNDKEFIEKILMFSKTINWVGIGIVVLLFGVSLFLIGNTIRLAVFSRRREIGIMKFVGATDWFIRWPFVIEGVVIGILGAVIADLLLFYGYNYAVVKITENLIAVKLVEPSYVLITLLWEFVLAGIAIGSFGSITSLRKFLNV